MRIAYQVNRFPALSQTFILNEITGLIERGHDIEILPKIAAVEGGLAHYSVDAYDLISKTIPYDMPRRPALRAAKALVLLLRELVSRRPPPLVLFNLARFGRDATSLRLFYAYLQLVGRPPYDIVNCQFGPSGLLAVRLREAGVLPGKIVTTFHGYDVSSYVQSRGNSVYSSLFEHGDLFIAISEVMAGRLIALGCPPERLLCLPLGVDLSAFNFKPRVIDESEPIQLISVGRLVEKKGYETSLRAFARLTQKHPNVTYNIVGEGPLRSHLEDLVESLGLKNRVKLLGEMTEDRVRAQYDRSHICILPSQTAPDGDQEGMPMVIKEAQAVGLPVIATRHSAVPEAVIDGVTGFLVDERDPEAIAERLEYLLANPHRWPQMGAAGRKLVEERFDSQKRNGQLAQALDRLLADGKHAEPAQATS